MKKALLIIALLLCTFALVCCSPTGSTSNGTHSSTPDNGNNGTAFSEDGRSSATHPIVTSISAGPDHIVGLCSDGTVVATGENDKGQCDVSEWRDITGVSAGSGYTVGLKSDGTVVTVGGEGSRQGFTGQTRLDVADWTNIVAVCAGPDDTVGLRNDGTVVVVGNNVWGQCDTSQWGDIVAIACGEGHVAGLRSDGTVITSGLKKMVRARCRAGQTSLR